MIRSSCYSLASIAAAITANQEQLEWWLRIGASVVAIVAGLVAIASGIVTILAKLRSRRGLD